MKNWFIFALSLILAGCVSVGGPGQIGMTDHRRVVILGEYIGEEEAKAYANKYQALVFYSPDRGAIAGATLKALTATLGPSSFMKRLMNEFRSMSNTKGEWEVVIPQVSERYFLVTLRNMENNAVVNSSGEIYLPESPSNSQIDEEVKRVFGNDWHVRY